MKRIFALMLASASSAFAQTYDRDTPAYLQNAPMRAESILATRAGPDIAIGYGHYMYNEPGVMMTLKANTPHVTLGYTVLADGGGAFVRGEVSGFATDVDYSGSTWGGSELKGQSSDLKVDARLLAGVDMLSAGDFVLAPYVGGAFRYLTDKDGTYNLSNVVGYDRRNMMFYGILGLDTRLNFVGLPLEWRNEYDRFLWGKQTSYFSSSGGLDVDNKQKSGNGYRTHLAWLNNWLDVGVYYQTWRIAQSDSAWDGSTNVVEPRNTTREYGVFVRHRF